MHGTIHAATPTELEAHRRRQAFREKIEAAAAALATKAPATVARAPIAPEAMPAETDPPKRDLNELLEFRRVIDELILQQSGHPAVQKIQRAAAQKFGITINDLCSARRTANIVLPRQIAMYLCKTHTLRSLPAIGRFFGNRDHSTVLHAVRKIANLMATNPEIAAEVHALEKIILGEQGEAAQ